MPAGTSSVGADRRGFSRHGAAATSRPSILEASHVGRPGTGPPAPRGEGRGVTWAACPAAALRRRRGFIGMRRGRRSPAPLAGRGGAGPFAGLPSCRLPGSGPVWARCSPWCCRYRAGPVSRLRRQTPRGARRPGGSLPPSRGFPVRRACAACGGPCVGRGPLARLRPAG